jgi:uncharacterized repeat protein (TIGR03803 family)
LVPSVPGENGYQTLYTFTGGADGAAPFDTVEFDSTTGNLYGTTVAGGAYGHGTIFQLAPDGSETVLYNFAGGADGGHPISFPHLFMDKKGNLFGTTSLGGASNLGTVFEFAHDGTFRTLYSFKGGDDGSAPWSGVIADQNGNFYGTTTEGGGSRCGGTGCGTVWELAPDGTETVLYSFGIRKGDGKTPEDGLLRDSAGNFFGTTLSGGKAGQGTVFEVASDGSEKVLHSFRGANDGSQPYDYLIEDSAGNLYGTTSSGGRNIPAGTVFKLAPQGNHYKETVIYVFQGGETDGGSPNGLAMGAQGNLYGTTYGGGSGNACAFGCGTIFELSPPAKPKHGKRWTETVLHFFTGIPDGGWPDEGVISDGKGLLYGTTSSGGEGSCYNGIGCGTVFKLNQ